MIELMIVVAIIAVLAAIAYPSYQNHIVKTRRAMAAACLMEAAQYMEREYTTKMTYAGAVLPDFQCRTDLTGHYAVSIESSSPTAFSVQAVPGTQQATRDARCLTLKLNQAGVKSITAEGGSASSCW